MTPFKIKLDPGKAIFDQVVFAATKAILGGALKPGEPFPSVRVMAKDLKIHPNTAHKVVQHLIQERWLIASPGRGTLVATPPRARSGDRKRLLSDEVEQLVVEARRVGAGLDEVIESVESHWKTFDTLKPVPVGASPARDETLEMPARPAPKTGSSGGRE
ncbi:MAG: GntR family transcriptional regulator [Gammaproteobacteria bacterium]|nr:GntR family transcriptional regulator [Gammaproteobacteria bacterium]MDP2139260.1 GntR family transcriptional regulator [Gammaproteobacteria bacterium]MDP2348971.1 GntR family transcriptional regulator [Gammaproteobacteria bacterium]